MSDLERELLKALESLWEYAGLPASERPAKVDAAVLAVLSRAKSEPR